MHENDHLDEWQETPKWHPRYWIGHTIRRWNWIGAYSANDGKWEYARPEKVARQLLHSMYAPTEPVQGQVRGQPGGELEVYNLDGKKTWRKM